MSADRGAKRKDAAMSAEPSESRTDADVAPNANTSTKRPVNTVLAPSFGDRVIYADGVHTLALRGGVAQLDLFQTLASTEKGESRVVTHRVVLPVQVVTGLMRMLSAAANAGAKATASSGAAHAEKKP